MNKHAEFRGRKNSGRNLGEPKASGSELDIAPYRDIAVEGGAIVIAYGTLAYEAGPLLPSVAAEFAGFWRLVCLSGCPGAGHGPRGQRHVAKSIFCERD